MYRLWGWVQARIRAGLCYTGLFPVRGLGQGLAQGFQAIIARCENNHLEKAWGQVPQLQGLKVRKASQVG